MARKTVTLLPFNDMPWRALYPEHAKAPLVVPEMALPQLFFGAAKTYPNRICVDFLGSTLTYAQVAHRVQQLAAGLQQQGVVPGTHVALVLPNCPYYVMFYIAVMMCGGVVVNVNPLYTVPEIEHLLENTHTKLAVVLDLPEHLAKLMDVAERHGVRVVSCPLADYLPGIKKFVYRGLLVKNVKFAGRKGLVPFERIMGFASTFHAPEVRPEDIALLQPTGGTTGVPKAAMLTHRNLVANTMQVRAWLGQPLPEGERFLCLLPFFHVFANTALLNLGLATGSTLVLLPKYEKKMFLQVVRRTKPTLMGVVPSLLAGLTANPKAVKSDLASVRFMIAGGAGLPPKVASGFTAKFGHEVHEGYGLTEASPVVACNVPGSPKLGSVGLPLPGTEVRVMSLLNRSTQAKTGEAGHIEVRGPQVMLGYYQNNKETKDVLSADGWLRTGDIGTLDALGYLSLTDREKDMVVVNGFKVFPKQVEEALMQHESVGEVLVVAGAHPHKGQVPYAFVTLNNKNDKVTTALLKQFAATRLNPLACPVEIFIRDSLPKTPLGKPCRKTLAAELAKMLDQQ